MEEISTRSMLEMSQEEKILQVKSWKELKAL